MKEAIKEIEEAKQEAGGDEEEEEGGGCGGGQEVMVGEEASQLHGGGKRGRKIGVGRIKDTRKSPIIIIITKHRLWLLNHIPYYF
jgi:hypothetical protein